MRKFISIIALLICMASVSFAQEKALTAVNDVTKASKATAAAVTSTGAIVATGINNGAAAFHESVVNGVSTLHQDLTAITPVVYGDGKSVIKTLYDDGTRAINYLVPKIESVITSLAVGLKTTTAEVWRILVYKQVANAVIQSIYVLLCLLWLGIYIYGMRKIVAVTKLENNWWNEGQKAFGVLGGMLSLATLVCIVLAIPGIVSGFMIPEAGALNEAIGYTQQLLQSFK